MLRHLLGLGRGRGAQMTTSLRTDFLLLATGFAKQEACDMAMSNWGLFADFWAPNTGPASNAAWWLVAPLVVTSSRTPRQRLSHSFQALQYGDA